MCYYYIVFSGILQVINLYYMCWNCKEYIILNIYIIVAIINTINIISIIIPIKLKIDTIIERKFLTVTKYTIHDA